MKARKVASTILLLAALGGAGYFVYTRTIAETAPKIEYKTAAVGRGRVTATVTASGTLSPLKTVQVGSQVSGKILELFADFNSEVKKGDLLAKLDPSLIESDKTKSKASLLSAQAGLTKSVADRDNLKQIYERTKSLAASKVVSEEEVQAAYVAYKAAKANVDASSASVSVARAAIDTVDVNLTYTTIVSPIDGVVISRDVSVGQTVAASLSAPTLFTIAEDLRQMEVHTNVAESDVGQLKAETQVRFTVDAYPNEKFRGVVQQIRNSPQTVSSVVTYDAVVRVQNDELKLRPGMTASVTFQVEDRKDAILVPNTALRYTPSDPAILALAPKLDSAAGGKGRRDRSADAETKPDEAKPADVAAPAPETKATDTKATDSKAVDTKSTDTKSKDSKHVEAKAVDTKHVDTKATDTKAVDTKAADAAPAANAAPVDKPRRNRSSEPSTERILWILVDGAPKPVKVQIGITDGTNTEIVGGELKEGDPIITGATGGETKTEAAPATSSPFNTGGQKTGGQKTGAGGGGNRRGGL